MVDNDVVVNQHRLRPRTKPQGQDEKEARAGTAAPTMEREACHDHFGSVHGGPIRWQRMDKEATKDDRRTGRQTGGGEGGKTRGGLRAGTSPADALAHVPCCHTKGDTIRVGLKGYHSRWPQTEGGEEIFFFFALCGVTCCRSRYGRWEVVKKR